ncbi:glycosyl hydrolase family 28-related protein [Nocardia amamiensis]|uniref:glycosyl hydrolase family 28-related protein n=1 Tax=Nocardia amamiensis TaxID=404578 RepID=UPI003400A8CC
MTEDRLLQNTKGKTAVRCFDTYAELRACSGGTTASPLNLAIGEEQSIGGIFGWSTDRTSADDGGTVIVPTDMARTGCWKRVYSGALNVKWFGAMGDGLALDTTAVLAALRATPDGGAIYFPAGVYKIDRAIDPGIKALALRGDGWRTLTGSPWGAPDWTAEPPAPPPILGSVIKAISGSEDAIRLSHETYRGLSLHDIALLGPGAGTAVGINAGVGAQNNEIKASNILIANFKNGIRFNNSLDSTLLDLNVRSCETGLFFESVVTDTRFYSVNIQDCTDGILARSGSLIRFYGGLFQNNTRAIHLSPDGAGTELWHLDGIWTEGNGKSLVADGSRAPISQLSFSAWRSGDTFAFEPTGTVTRVSFTSCDLPGWTFKPVSSDWLLCNVKLFDINFSLDPQRLTRINVNGVSSFQTHEAFQVPWNADTITLDSKGGELQQIVMTGDVAQLNPPTYRAVGSKVVLIVTQGGAGGFTIRSFGSNLRTDWSGTGPAGTSSSMTIMYIGQNNWMQVTPQTAWI